MAMNNRQYSTEFDEVYKLLLQLSVSIQHIRETSFHLTRAGGGALPPAWSGFQHFFQTGEYFHHRCQGYVESLLVTGGYAPRSVNIWVNQLVYTANEHFKQAMPYWDQVMRSPGFAALPQFAALDRQLKEFWPTEGRIMVAANRLNTAAPPSGKATQPAAGQAAAGIPPAPAPAGQ
ncbi:hypothetical protein N0M98_09250 [Paenibacillus doosanensis]|uniref:Uncharacterized protein n=1 Tax=Paenibacillus konkukensis TaxID=2020716 RepID=A0ABY4RWR2_9BACL|nr:MULTISPECIES: hypothetical protein [Paenibacillus]MCS7460328.1 hypothetical protein [Paenibacillus doosanensis]UQZ86126.1 hypothetical protein SK3146_05418 [Paenibacillus konkukensis]